MGFRPALDEQGRRIGVRRLKLVHDAVGQLVAVHAQPERMVSCVPVGGAVRTAEDQSTDRQLPPAEHLAPHPMNLHPQRFAGQPASKAATCRFIASRSLCGSVVRSS